MSSDKRDPNPRPLPASQFPTPDESPSRVKAANETAADGMNGPDNDAESHSPFDFWEDHTDAEDSNASSTPAPARHVTLVQTSPRNARTASRVTSQRRFRRVDISLAGEFSRNGGWLIGIVFGIVLAVWMLVPVRYTLASQLHFGLFSDTIPWLRSLDTRHSLREAPHLDAVAGSEPTDYLLQVGRATALASVGGLHPIPSAAAREGSRNVAEETDSTLIRLASLGRDFPQSPGVYAHLVRYMMAERVHIQRAELMATGQGSATSPPRSLPVRSRDVRLLQWALQSGERLDPENGFWPAMRAVVYLAAVRDEEALGELRRAALKTRWDAYLYEEVLGQWRLYSLAYGDNGAAQKIGPLSLLAFPHLGELRKAGSLARWLSDTQERAGHIGEAIRIRRSIARVGFLMREKAPWSYEALYGSDLMLIACTDGGFVSGSSDNAAFWRQRADRYLTLLRKAKRPTEALWDEQQIEASCALRESISRVRFDTPSPGIPPGIPLLALFRAWVAGVCLLQQIAGMACIGLLAWGVPFLVKHRPKRAQIRYRRYAGFVAAAMAGGAAYLLWAGIPTVRLAGVFLTGSLLTFVIAAAEAQRAWWRRFGHRHMVQGDTGKERKEWGQWQTLCTLALLLPLGLGGLYTLRDWLAGLHPVAVLLSNLVGSTPAVTPRDTLQLALLALALPMSVVPLVCLWALRRGHPILPTLLRALRSLCLPAIGSLALCYLLLLNLTLRLDADASRAINEAAQNDLHWVLTHGSDTP